MTGPSSGSSSGPVSGTGAAGRPRADLTVESVHETYAPGGGRDACGTLDAQVTLRVRTEGLGAAVPRRPPERTEVVIIDCSGSMGHPAPYKIAAARTAAAAAVEMLPDGTHFALVAGTDTARVVYPWGDPDAPATVAASPDSRAEGSRTALTLDAHGGTRISAWLTLARRLLTARPDAAFRHALLLTDGQDRHGRAEELRRVLDDCAGEFACDALGIGEDWDALQLRQITRRLRGRTEAVVEGVPGGTGTAGGGGGPDEGAAGGRERPEDQLTRLFRELVGASTSRMVPQLLLGVRTEPHLAVTLFRQVYPTTADLTDTAVHDGDRTVFPTGAWGDETRWYELRMRVDPGHPDHPDHPEPADHRRAGGVRIAALWLETGGTGNAGDAGGAGDVALPGETPVTAGWTGTSPPLTDPGVAGRHFRRSAELEEAVLAGCAALDRDDVPAAEQELGRAVRLAHELGDETKSAWLRSLVTVENAVAGRVRVREAVDPGHLQALIALSDHTTPPPVPDGPGDRPWDSGRPVRCPACTARVRPGRFCENCGRALGEER